MEVYSFSEAIVMACMDTYKDPDVVAYYDYKNDYIDLCPHFRE